MLFDSQLPFALFENQIDKSIEKPFDLFFNAIEEVKAYEVKNVNTCLNRIQDLSDKKYYLVGYMAYEAMIDFAVVKKSKDPLLHFYAFTERRNLSVEDFEKEILPILIDKNHKSEPTLAVYDFKLNEAFASYEKKITKIKEYQRCGDTYQVNFTMKNRFKWQGDAFQFFLELKKYQKVAMAAFFHFDKDICSYSPELFIQKNSDIITSKPMKGTAPRGLSIQEDNSIVTQMRKDTKIMSENLMIVDLIRNDLGRIALPGTVKVTNLFHIDTYPTLHQMTSTVQAQVVSNLKINDLLEALFPCGSITGAPKKSTMKIINELECESRGVYTGAIGFILPSGDFIFNVAIRTLILTADESGTNDGEMGIGSGIIYESDIVKEWEESLLKAKFIKMINSPFQLIETFRYESDSNLFLRFNLHLKRLVLSAEMLGFTLPVDKIIQEINNLRTFFIVNQYIMDQKIRLLLFQNGGFQLTYSPIENLLSDGFKYKVICCKMPICKKSIFQRYKTTFRKFYEDYLQRALRAGYDEVLFFNEQGWCVEASRHNIIIKQGHFFITPPVSEGALPGVFRQSLLLDKSFDLKEKNFGRAELLSADEIFLCNSVRGLVRAEVVFDWLEEI